MPMPRRALALVSLVGLTACPNAPSFDNLNGTGTAIASETLETSATSEEPVPTTGVFGTSGEPPTSSSDADPDDSSTTHATTSAQLAEPPTVKLTVSPAVVEAAGDLQLALEMSADVDQLEFYVDGVIQADYSKNKLPSTWPITSQAQCEQIKSFKVVVYDGDDLDGEDEQALTCLLPASGSEADKQQLPGATRSIVHALAVVEDGFVAAGEMDDRMVVWRLDRDLNLRDKWPLFLGDWTAIAGLDDLESSATAIVVAADRTIVVAGNTSQNGTSTYYVARLTASGSRMAEVQGKPHEEAAGVAVTADGVIVVAGSVKISNLPTHDWRVWGYPELAGAPAWTDTLPLGPGEAPDLKNERSERARGIAALPNGEVVVVGSREYTPVGKPPFTRASWQRYTSVGARVGATWTSDSEVDMHDVANAVVAISEDAFAATGSRLWPGKLPQQVSWRFDGGLLTWDRAESGVVAEGKAISRDGEGNLVVASVLTEDKQLDAWAFGFAGPQGLPLWAAPPYGGPGWDGYHAVACDRWGYCLVGGFLTEAGATTGFVRLHNP